MGVLNQTMLTTQLTWENKLLSVLKVAGSLKKKKREKKSDERGKESM